MLPLALPLLLAAAMPSHPASPQDQTIHAPDLAGREWLNTDRPLSSWKDDLHGQVVLLDFWTYCCINCMHVLPELGKLEQQFHDQPFLIIGVHSNKFEQEGEARNIRQAILRYGIQHPVVVDEEHRIWDAFDVHAWPTLVLVDPEGYVLGTQSGEVKAEDLAPVIQQVLDQHRAKGTLAKGPLQLRREAMPDAALHFPGKVRAFEDKLYVSDSSGNRVLEVEAQSGKILRQFGSGTAGFQDGEAAAAQFRNPQGTAVLGGALYVADTDNHALRRVDLKSGKVETAAGNGRQADFRPEAGAGLETSLNSPWDLAVDGSLLYIAMAGSHQLWSFDTARGRLAPLAGSGRENILDGAARMASLAQPSGLALAGRRLYFADAEVSAVRYLDLDKNEVHTLVGTGLFEFGDSDGKGDAALLQHCLGVAAWGDQLLVADTYNNKIKQLDPATRTASSFLGTGSEVLDEKELTLWEPGGLDVAGDTLYVADTNHNRVLAVDLKSKAWRVVLGG